jgi:toxin-antitoxin system PIN domain toxin
MIAIDSNVLIAAHRTEHPRHDAALARLTSIAEGHAPWGLPVFVVGEFLRVITHARIFDPPTALHVACDFIAALLSSPSARLLSPGPRYWTVLRAQIIDADARGNLAFDAMIAAVCIETGASPLITEDRDFGRFRGLSVQRL